jgi:hypothetical protein
MSKINYDGSHWTPDTLLFTYSNLTFGPLAVWHGQTFGGTSAAGFFGPDICAPGGITYNPATATGPGWDQPWGNAAAGGPAICFVQDANIDWKRGHQINGEWGGPGNDWANLVPLSAQANANHSTVEGFLRTYLTYFRTFDQSNGGHTTYWYCVLYWVQASTACWSAGGTVGDLYSYCPNFIKVTWRVMRLVKPVGAPGTSAATAISDVPNYLANPPMGALTQATDAQIMADCPGMPQNTVPIALTNNPDNVAEAGDPVQPLPVNAPAIPGPASAYDGHTSIFQN